MRRLRVEDRQVLRLLQSSRQTAERRLGGWADDPTVQQLRQQARRMPLLSWGTVVHAPTTLHPVGHQVNARANRRNT